MNRWIHIFVVLGLAWGVPAAATDAVADCKPVGDLIPICGLRGSEDLEVLPGGKQLFVSQSRVDFTQPPAMLWLPGSIAVLDLQTRKPRSLYPVRPVQVATATWGDPACPGEIGERLAPHGLHLSRLADGKQQLLVVNHGGRESIEFFEVVDRRKKLGLEWRGCAVAPEYSFLNDVVGLPSGGFLVTTMTRNDSPDAMMRDRPRADRGEKTGHVWRWRREEGYTVLPGSESPMPNGIQIDAAGTAVYVSVGGGVRKVDLASGKTLGFVQIHNPDNSSWSADGQLLVAGIVDDAEIMPCLKATFAVACGIKSYVAVVDPATLTIRRVIEHEGPPMGLFTIAVQVGRYLYVGSAAGDRVMRMLLRE